MSYSIKSTDKQVEDKQSIEYNYTINISNTIITNNTNNTNNTSLLKMVTQFFIRLFSSPK